MEHLYTPRCLKGHALFFLLSPSLGTRHMHKVDRKRKNTCTVLALPAHIGQGQVQYRLDAPGRVK